MKPLRILVLVLLAVLLPARGAIAGATWCASHGASHSSSHGTPAVDADGDMPMPPDHAAMAHGHAQPDGGHHETHDPHGQPAEGQASGTCQFCASGCCMASIVAGVPSLGAAAPSAAAVFPPLLVPAPAFESDGPERPPRAG